MSGVFKGLADLQRHESEREAAAGNKVNWLKVEPDTSVEIVFLQEMDESSDRYLESNGTVLFAQEHSNPEIFYKRVVCTNNEDHDFECWPCETNRQMWDANQGLPENSPKKYKGGWKAKLNMYVNVLVRREGEEDEVMVLSRARNKNSYVDQLIEDAVDDGYISNRWYRLTRSGDGRDTTYRLKALKDANLDLSTYELHDLSKVVTTVGYEGQPAALGVKPVAERVDIPVDDEDDSDSDSWL